MKYTLTNIKRYQDFLKCEVMDENGQETLDVALNKDKWGAPFDSFKNNDLVEANLWQSGTKKWYLFPVTEKKTTRTNGIAKAQEKKAQDIALAQGNKYEGIKLSSAMRQATDIVVQMMATNTALGEEPIDWQEEHRKTCDWILSEWERREYDSSDN